MKDPRFYFNGQRFVPSATTVLPSPDLKDWAAGCAVDHVLHNNLNTAPNCFVIIAGSASLEARKAYRQLSTEAADYGTYIHALCQWSLENDIKIESKHEMTQKFMDGLWAWKIKRNVVVIAMETEVTTDLYGGRLDLVCEMDSFWMTKAWCKKYNVEWYKDIDTQRVIVLVDFKTGKSSYYNTWKYQLAGYRQAYNEMMSRRAEKLLREDSGLGERAWDRFDLLREGQLIQHHGILKFNKDTMKVNYKDFTIYDATRYKVLDKRKANGKLPTEKYIRDYERDRKTFNAYVSQWWLTNQGVA